MAGVLLNWKNQNLDKWNTDKLLLQMLFFLGLGTFLLKRHRFTKHEMRQCNFVPSKKHFFLKLKYKKLKRNRAFMYHCHPLRLRVPNKLYLFPFQFSRKLRLSHFQCCPLSQMHSQCETLIPQKKFIYFSF